MSSEALTFIKGIMPFYRSAPRTAAVLVALTVLTAALFAAIPLMLRSATDAAFQSDVGVGSGTSNAELAALAAVALAWVAASSAARFIHGNFNDRVSASVRRRVYDSWLHHEGASASGVLGRLTGDIAAFHVGLELASSALPVAAAQCVLALFFMAEVDGRLFALAVLSLTVIGGAFLLVERRLARLSSRAQEAYSAMVSLAAEILPEYRFVQRFGQEASEVERFDREQMHLLGRLKRLRQFNLAARAGIFASLAGGSILLFIAGVTRVQDGTLSSGSLIAFFTLLLVAGTSFVRTIDAWAGIAQAAAPLRRIREMSDAAGVERRQRAIASVQETDLAGGPGTIELSDASFHYPSATTGFRVASLNMTIEPGSTVGFVGRSGSGKSTIARLIAGELRPSSGAVLIGGKPTSEVRHGRRQREIAYVAATPTLFTRSLTENVAFGDSGADESRISEALDDAQLPSDHPCFPDGLATILDARGERLSSGQRQRVAIAQSILLGPQVIILDEAASSVDSETEARLVRKIFDRFPESTKIIVSHRLSSVRDCTRIFVFEEGVLKEQGTHRELIANDKTYAELFREQMTAS